MKYSIILLIALFAIVYAKPAEKDTTDSKKSDEPKSKSEPADKDNEKSDDDSKEEHSKVFGFLKERAKPILGAFQERIKARKEHEHESS